MARAGNPAMREQEPDLQKAGFGRRADGKPLIVVIL
jgi:hypothetical protein